MKAYKYLLTMAAVLFTASACTESAVDDLTGVYTAPVQCKIVSATNLSSEKIAKNKRLFDTEFTTQDGSKLNLKFIGDSYFLHAAAFTPAEESDAKKGNYLVGAGGSSYNDGSGKANIVKGQVVVAKDGDNYTLSGNLWLDNGTVLRLSGGGTLVYEEDPEPIALTRCLSYANNNANGTASITLILATDGVEAVPNAWGGVDYSGSGNYLAVDFYSTDGSLAEGAYAPADANVMTAMTYGKGWDPGDLWGIGIEFTNWATCWWTVGDGEPSAVHIEEGNINVKQEGGKWVISYSHNGLMFEFNGIISELGGGGGQVSYDTQLTQCLSAVDNSANGTPSITLILATDGVEAVPNAWGGMDYSGEGNYLAVDFYTPDGKLYGGKYAPADANALSTFTYGKGWDPGDLWGIGIEFANWGTCWWTVGDGEPSAVHVEEGDILVEYADGIFTISYANGNISCQYKGALEGIEGVPGEGGNDPVVDFEDLSQCLSYANNTANGTMSVTLILATDGVEAVPNAWGGMDYSGDGNYLAIDLYSADGSIEPGTYTAAPASEMAPGTFGMGWDPGDLWGIGIDFANWGTCWWTVGDGDPTAVHVEDGSVEVSEDGGVYTISLVSSTVNARFIGNIEF